MVKTQRRGQRDRPDGRHEPDHDRRGNPGRAAVEDQPVGEPRRETQRDDRQRHLQRTAGSQDHAREDVAAEIVGAKRKLRAWRF